MVKWANNHESVKILFSPLPPLLLLLLAPATDRLWASSWLLLPLLSIFGPNNYLLVTYLANWRRRAAEMRLLVVAKWNEEKKREMLARVEREIDTPLKLSQVSRSDLSTSPAFGADKSVDE